MTHMRCPVCRGEKTIKLPLYRESVAALDPDVPMQTTMEETSRRYPCPECAPTASEANVAFIKCGAEIAIHDEAPGYAEYAKKSLAHALADLFLRGGHITFTKEKTERGGWQQSETLRATLGVVSPSIVASMEQRIAERQDVVASEVAEAAAAGIRVWNSYYTGDDGSIQKSQAVDAVREALKAVLERRRLNPPPSPL